MSLSFLALVSKFKREEIGRTRLKIAEKIWGGRSPDEVLAKRYKLFVLLMIFLIAISTLIKEVGITYPNIELIIPTLIVVGSFSLYCGSSKFWRYLNRYFGVVTLVSVYLIYLASHGFLPIYAFTWSGFVLAWFLGMRNKLSLFDGYKKLLFHTTLAAAIAILAFDIWTAFGSWLGWAPKTVTGLTMIYINQIPFTLYHFASLIFVPPLVGLGKLLVRVKVPVPVAARIGSQAKVSNRR